MAIPFYGQNKDGGNLDKMTEITPNYMDYLSGYQGNLATGAAVTDAEADAAAAGATVTTIAAATLLPGLNTLAHDTNAAGSVYLPPCLKDTHVAVTITGDMDEANACTFFTRGAGDDAAVLAKQIISPQFLGGAATNTEQIVSDGTAAAPTAIKLIYTPAAADTNFLGANSVIHFYAPVAGEWLVKIINIAEGTGATGALTTSTS